MEFDLTTINKRIDTMPQEYIQESEEYFTSRMRRASDEIFYNLDESPIVLLSGPSASGKTTASKKLANELKRLGINAVSVSLDNYFITVDPETSPRTSTGEIDRESPKCLDMDLLNKHFHMLSAGEQIQIPHFSFSHQARDPERTTPMKLGNNEIAVFEGIHALNECITHEHPRAYKIYVSTMTDIMDHGELLIDRAGLRLVRRIVRDDYFRGADPQVTLEMWANIRRGELQNILPYKDAADMAVDSALPYEISVMKQFTGDLFDRIPKDTEQYDVLRQILNAFRLFITVDPAFVPADSLLREFIGGSCFEY